MSITDKIESSTELAKPLTELINKGCHPVGGIYRLDYDTAIVLTDDFKKQQSGGVPRAGFLLAVAGEQTDKGFILEDQEVILLRVRGTAPLPNEGDLVQTRLAVVRDASTSGVGFDEVTDVLTRNELQQSAFDCQVVGTFYTASDDKGAPILFGADIDNVMVSARYQVYLPSPEVLSWLASFSESPEVDDSLVIGHVRYAATRRKAVIAGTDKAEVKIHVSDFVGRKTAVFGMTRTGKSNTIKTLVTSVHQYASEKGEKIGQLIFDPQGEYANVNQQDGTGLRLLGDDDTSIRIYKVKPDPSEAIEKDLRFNFYDTSILDAVWSLVSDSIAGVETNYGKKFRAVNLEEPDPNDRSAYARWQWTLIAFYGLLSKCGYTGTFAGGKSLRIAVPDDKATDFLAAHAGAISGASGKYSVNSPADCLKLADWVGSHEGDFPKWFGDDCHFKDVYGVYPYTGVISEIKLIRDFHSASASGDVGEHLWDDMQAGRLAIVDLSAGNDKIAKVMSERVVTHLLNMASNRFRDGKDPIPLQVVVEEAHNLFERNGGKDVGDDPWVRLSKEAAKYKMGLVYATQEVTSVDKRILSNTSNWLIAHLNSDHETKELSHYYDFSVWAPSLIRVEDVGFVRMKTYSGKYVVPVQVSKFDHQMVNDARVAAGLDPHDFSESA